MKLSIPIERFTSPAEDSLPLLRLYFRSLVTGTLKPCWCPVLYVVALSHINSFIFSQDAAAQVLVAIAAERNVPKIPKNKKSCQVGALWVFLFATVQAITQSVLVKPEGAGRNLEL